MKLLLKSIGTLAAFAVLVGLLVKKLGGLFPEMSGVAWGIILAGFGVWIFLAIKSEVWVEKLWPGRFSEDQRIWLAIVVVLSLGGIVLYCGWDFIGRYLSAHFGPVVR